MKRLWSDGEPDSPNLHTDLIQVSAVYNTSLLCQGRFMSSVTYKKPNSTMWFKKKKIPQVIMILEY